MRVIYIVIAWLFIAAIVYSCSRKTVPSMPERPVEPVNNKPDTADFRSGDPLIAGRAIYKIKCIRCHDEKPVDNWSQDEWRPILNAMVKKTKLNDLETAQVTAYVNKYAKK